jgi:hypothetical protein
MAHPQNNSARTGRSKIIPIGYQKLDIAAPAGTYLLDSVVEEFRHRGIFPSVDDLMERARIGNNCTCAAAIFHVQISLLGPMYRRHTKRLFGDLALIRHLIERNKNLDHFNVTLSENPQISDCHKTYESSEEAFRHLQDNLGVVSEEIKVFLRAYELEKSLGGNHDPLSHTFIRDGYVTWRILRSEKSPLPRSALVDPDPLSNEHFRLFARFLAAGWRDASLPLTDHRGQSREPLEEWLADRVRKYFAGWNLPPDDIEANSEDK